MECKICRSKNVEIDYHGLIRKGSFGDNLDENVNIFYCPDCGVRWHEYQLPERYYEDSDYWESLIGKYKDRSKYVESWYNKYGDRVLECLEYVGTKDLYGKIVADYGCGEGLMLDFIKGGIKTTIGIEYNVQFVELLKKRGHEAYLSVEQSLEDWKNKVDLVMSFDVIEHVIDPVYELSNLFQLLKEGGKIIMGTPTDSPILRTLLGRKFEEFLFHVGHPWIFSEESLRFIFEQAGFANIEIRNVNKYSIGNVLGWMQEEKPVRNKEYDFITQTLDNAWKNEVERLGKGDYLIVKAEKC